MKKKETRNLLVEVGEFDGVFDKFTDALAPWKEFAGLLGANAQKLMAQATMPLKLVFSLPKTNANYKKMWNEHKGEIEKIKGEIGKYEDALGEAGGPGAKALAIFNPGAALAIASSKGAFDFFQDPSESAVGKGLRAVGLHYLPGLGFLEETNKGFTSEEDWIDYLENAGKQRDQGGGGGGTLSNLFSKIQGVFLLDFSHYERPGPLISEAAGKNDPNTMVKALIIHMQKSGVLEKMEKVAEEVNAKKEEYLEEYIVQAQAVMNIGVESFKANTIEEFGKIIKKYSKDFDDLKKIDLKKVDEELEKSVNDLVADEEKALEFVEMLEKEGDEIEKDKEGKIIEEDFRKKAKTIFYHQTRSEIMEELKVAIENTYSTLQKTIINSEGLNDPNVREQIVKTPAGKKHMEIITKNLEKLNEVMGKIEEGKN